MTVRDRVKHAGLGNKAYAHHRPDSSLAGPEPGQSTGTATGARASGRSRRRYSSIGSAGSRSSSRGHGVRYHYSDADSDSASATSSRHGGGRARGRSHSRGDGSGSDGSREEEIWTASDDDLTASDSDSEWGGWGGDDVVAATNALTQQLARSEALYARAQADSTLFTHATNAANARAARQQERERRERSRSGGRSRSRSVSRCVAPYPPTHDRAWRGGGSAHGGKSDAKPTRDWCTPTTADLAALSLSAQQQQQQQQQQSSAGKSKGIARMLGTVLPAAAAAPRHLSLGAAAAVNAAGASAGGKSHGGVGMGKAPHNVCAQEYAVNGMIHSAK